MVSYRLARYWVLLVGLYVAADFMDPSIPGVFFFDSEELFVDGAVQVKSNASRDYVVTAPPRLFGDAYDDENVTAKVHALAHRPRQSRWSHIKHDDSASFALASPPDSSPTSRL